MQVRLRALLVVVALSLLFCAWAALADPPPLRISPLGDSITWGMFVPGGYRLPLYGLLTNAGYTIDYVGTQQGNPADDLPDPDHDGYNGWTINMLDAVVDHVYDSIPYPDVVLLLIGVNDFYYQYKTNTAWQRLDLLIEHVATKRPNTKIVVANLLETSSDLVNDAVTNLYNPRIPIICSNHTAQGQQVYFINMHDSFTLADLDDGLHPSQDGYRIMATNWFSMITNLFSPLGSTNPPAISRVTALTNWTNIVVEFSKPVADNATNISNYGLDGGLTILDASLELTERRLVTLLTSPFATNSPYMLTVSGVQDITTDANTIRPASTFAFTTPALSGDCPGNLVTPLTDQSTCAGGAVVFSTTVLGGPGPITYAWAKDGVALPIETNNTLVVSNIVASNAGSYCVIVTGACSSLTNCATLSVWTNTSAVGPSDVTICSGRDLTLCTVALGTGPFTYQWCRGATPLEGQTNDCLTLTNVLVGDADTYCVKVTGLCSSVTNCAIVSVITNIVASAPINQTACAGGAVVFSTMAFGPAPITYAWAKDGIPLAGETNSTLVVTNVVAAHAGSYCVIVSGPCNSLTNCATLSVWTNTTAIGPNNVSICPGQDVKLCTVASGTGPFTYQWCRGTTPLDGQTNDCLTLTNLLVKDSDTYCVQVTGFCNSVTNSAIVSVVTNIVASGPMDQTACRGGPITLCTVPQGAGPFSYLWRKDGIALSGATNSCLMLSNLKSPDAGSYCVEIAWNCLRLTNCAILNVVRETKATSLTSVSNVCPGETVIFSTSVSGTGPFNFAWSKDGVEIAGATNNSYTINAPSPLDSGNYCVKVTGACNTVTNCASLDVNTPTTVIGPQSLTNCLGSSATLNVMAFGTGPHTYQWSKEQVEIPGATNSTFAIPSVSAGDAGNYCVVVRGPCDSVTRCATISLTQQTSAVGPSDTSACAGADATLCTVASGIGPFQYQWRKGDLLLAGETNDCLTLRNISAIDVGAYCVEVSGLCNTVTNCATLSLSTNTTALGPANATVCPGESVTLCTVPSGTGPFAYQWCRGITPLAGQTNDCLTLTNLALEDAGSYCVKVTGVCNTVTNCAVVAVVTNIVASGPIDQTTCPGSAVSFCTVADGPGPFSYLWSKDGTAIADATNSCLVLSNVTTADAGTYCVEIAQACLRLTNCAALTVLPETQATPVASASNLCVGDSVTFNTTAAGVGPFACKWSKAGVEIPDATNAWYTIAPVSPTDAGTYCVVVNGACGSVTNCASLSLASVSMTQTLMRHGDFTLTFAGPNGFTYELRATEDPRQPLSQWEVLTNGTFTADPAIFVESGATNRPLRFFQVLSHCPSPNPK